MAVLQRIQFVSCHDWPEETCFHLKDMILGRSIVTCDAVQDDDLATKYTPTLVLLNL